jgi:hypothetical protein
MDRIQSAAYQKDCMCRRAFSNWGKDYYLAQARNDLQVNATRRPLDRVAYQSAISQPPSEVNHPLWSAAVAMDKDTWGHKTRCPLYPWWTTSMVLQLAIDHSFTGSYTSWFRPLNPPTSLWCPCGVPLHNPHHLIRDCYLHYLHRVSCKITTHGRTLPLCSLFSQSVELAHRLLSFIHLSRAAMRPPEIGRPPLEPD